jgi:NADH:ubiquinone oxidoreductase subunit C
MTDARAVVASLRRRCADLDIVLSEGAGGEQYGDVPASRLIQVVESLVRAGILHHLSAISATRDGDGFRVLYHLWLEVGLTLCVHCPDRSATLPSLGHTFAIASWYEREVHDMFGIQFSSHPDLRPLLLPEDWNAPPPMLQEPDPCQS